MASTGILTGVWHPRTERERQLVRSQLERVVRDGRFAASKRYPCLLRYVVENALAGTEDNLKERTLGIEVFHRSPDYDTNLDPVVRLCAAEVRKRLAQYYQSAAHEGELRIELNPGSYVPVFSQPVPDSPVLDVIRPAVPFEPEQASQPRKTRKVYWLAGLTAAGMIIVLISILGTRHSRQIAKQQSNVDEIWSPLLTSSKPILFCVGGTEMLISNGTRLSHIAATRRSRGAVESAPDRCPAPSH